MTRLLPTVVALTLSGSALGASPNPPAPVTHVHAAAYAVVDLGSLGRGDGGSGDVLAINDKGVAAGWVREDGSNYAHVWPGGRLSNRTVDLMTLGYAINDAGTVAGAVLGCPTGCPDGTLWSDGARWQAGRLDVLKPVTTATGINNAGLVVGYDSVDGLGTRAVAWRDGSLFTFAPLAQIQNKWVAEAHAVNDANTVVGKSLLAEPGIEHAFTAQLLARGVAPTIDLGTLPPPFRESNAFAVSNAGLVVGASSVAWGYTTCHAVMWIGRKIVDLGALTPSSWGGSVALGVDEAGDVVGFAGGVSDVDGYAAQEGTRAVLWHGGTAVDLNDMIGAGWDLRVAHDVNNRGEIVGSGIKVGDSAPHGFMLVPLTRIDSLTLSSSVVTGGKPSQATIKLNRAAPAGGETVFVKTSFPGTVTVVAPTTVTVRAGQSSATFAVATTSVKRTTAGTITGTLDGRERTASLTVTSRS